MTNIADRVKALSRSLKKYKYALLILFIGLVLLLLPGEGEKDPAPLSETRNETFDPDAYVRDMEQRLCQILSQIRGVGQTQVILTLSGSEELHYLYDSELRTDSAGSGTTAEEMKKTVILSSGSAYDEAMITRRDYPLFQGALIVCQGGGEAEVKLKLTQAVSALTDLSSDKITILEMKLTGE